MNLEQWLEAALVMDDTTWKRHANPWSVWTRYTVLPLLVAAVWSRVWLGWWSIAPVALALVWNWVNPRLFPPPDSTNNWSSKAVLGERVWLNRDNITVPTHHRHAPTILGIVAGIGAVFVIWGSIELDLWITLFGAALVYCGKLWFLDRMVWLYEDMKDATPEYRSWLY
ncbi:MAG: hypothetical protein J7641_04560 [Cyanobacteria bacterium SID2]|nr:hypothetical protein [Cyanobacteria bacterium SID2]MBP0004320.1 hypothetical protein [Cyanobacteria bacterium SBC]